MATSLNQPTPEQLMGAHTDIRSVDEVVELQIGKNGMVWVNIGGVCVMRITGAVEIIVKDER